MITTSTITKKSLEAYVNEIFLTLGKDYSSSLLESLKDLGFYYAAVSGLSVSIEDLKTPESKVSVLEAINVEISGISHQWQRGLISDEERFQAIINTWSRATEVLKNKIIEQYQNLDPTNSLNIMAFSGARGNISQVRQLVGMRGLMADQKGKIIDLPIQSSFREGLSPVDYIVSSYGARKGIVDTALKTADAGYLTRRLVYLAQSLVIRQINCQTSVGVFASILTKKTDLGYLLGRVLLKTSKGNFAENAALDEKKIQELKKLAPLFLSVRSPLTCKSSTSLCQNCYGSDLSKNKLISLGEAVGVIAAQSIGEPGTQLTMRTFHTGGVFTSEKLHQTLAPFSGTLIIPSVLKSYRYRTAYGIFASKITIGADLTLIDWKGAKSSISVESGSILYTDRLCFVKKGQLIAENLSESSNLLAPRLKPVYTHLAGEIFFENLVLKIVLRDDRFYRIVKGEIGGTVWITSGKSFSLPKEIFYKFPTELNSVKSFALLKIVTPFSGLVELKNGSLSIHNENKTIVACLNSLPKLLVNCSIIVSILVKNYQYVDEQTILAYFYIFPNANGKIYLAKQKIFPSIHHLFLIANSDIWRVAAEQVSSSYLAKNEEITTREGSFLSKNTKLTKSGILIEQDGFQRIFQNAVPIFLSKGAVLNYRQGDFILEKKALASLVSSSQQTEDIVQGLPKVERLVEAQRPRAKAILAQRPGIFEKSKKIYLKKEKRTVLRLTFQVPFEGSALVKSNFFKQKYGSINLPHFEEYDIDPYDAFYFEQGNFVEVGQPLSGGEIDPHDLLHVLYRYHCHKDGLILGTTRSVHKFRLILSNSLSALYFSQGVNISCKHIEIIARQLTVRAAVLELENTDFELICQKVSSDVFGLALEKYNLFEKEAKNEQTKRKKYFKAVKKSENKKIKAHNKGKKRADIKVYCHKMKLTDENKDELLEVKAEIERNAAKVFYKEINLPILWRGLAAEANERSRKIKSKRFYHGELFRLSYLQEIHFALLEKNKLFEKTSWQMPSYEPRFLSATNSSLKEEGFLAPAGFQETKKVLTDAAIYGKIDWLKGLKENIIVGRLIPAGTSFLDTSGQLDSGHYYKSQQLELEDGLKFLDKNK